MILGYGNYCLRSALSISQAERISEILNPFFISTLLNAGIYASFRLALICKA